MDYALIHIMSIIGSMGGVVLGNRKSVLIFIAGIIVGMFIFAPLFRMILSYVTN